MSTLGAIDWAEVEEDYLRPVDLGRVAKKKVDGVVVKKESLDLDTAPRCATELSGLFNKPDMDLTSGISAVDGIDGTKLMVDPSATSTVDMAELFPELTDLLSGAGSSSPDGAPDLVSAAMTTTNVGPREQLPSTSSYTSGGEMSDYEEGLSPAEVDSTLEHFFNTFTDLEGFLNVPAETSPAATVDTTTVRSLIDDTTCANTETSSTGFTVDNIPFTDLPANVSRIVKEEGPEQDETCQVTKRSRTSSGASRPTSVGDSENLYRKRREKNNIACKRARQNRKKRENELEDTATTLEAENDRLRARIEELTEIAESSRKALVQVLAK